MTEAAPSYSWHWNVLFTHDAAHVLVVGLKFTLLVGALSLVFGSLVGLVVALLRLWRKPVISQLAYIYTDFFRTTPFLVQLIWIFYVLPILVNVSFSPVVSGVMALSLNAGAFMSEIFRSGFLSIPQGQHDAAFVLGLSPVRKFVHVLFPQAMRRVVPPIGNMFISLIKDSSLLTVIAVPELTYESQVLVTNTFRPLEIYTAVAVVYFVLTYPLSLLATALERKFPIR
jgi:polar amino acid transport system permease protein